MQKGEANRRGNSQMHPPSGGPAKFDNFAHLPGRLTRRGITSRVMPGNRYGAVGEAEERGPRFYGGIVAAALVGVAVLAVIAVASFSTSTPVKCFHPLQYPILAYISVSVRDGSVPAD